MAERDFCDEVRQVVCDTDVCPLANVPDSAWRAAAREGQTPYYVADAVGNRLGAMHGDVRSAMAAQEETPLPEEELTVLDEVAGDTLGNLQLNVLRPASDETPEVVTGMGRIAAGISSCVKNHIDGTCRDDPAALF